MTQQSFLGGHQDGPEGLPGVRHRPCGPAYVEANGFSVVRDFVGHGVGAKLHEAPEVRNFGPQATVPGSCRV